MRNGASVLVLFVGLLPAVAAPIPTVKAKPPTKLDRPQEAPEELRKELTGWDEKYRHGSEEKFAEMEKRAEELVKECESDHDRARVWYAVAHVAAQSGVGIHADRVRKYAEKCLKLSRDPLDRGRMYSYLASCEEVAKGAFADRRKNSTDWLLKGYLELLVQELPDQKPELPAVEKSPRILGDGADDAAIRARIAAQIAAREQAVWVGEQIFRRDVLVMQFRNLYDQDPDQLRKPAEAVLPTREDVDTLLKRVQPKK